MEKSWNSYITAIGQQKPPASSIATGLPFTNTVGTQPTGFGILKPTNNDIQKRYDAMSGSWEGVRASDIASTKIFKAEHASVTK